MRFNEEFEYIPGEDSELLIDLISPSTDHESG